jgi:transcriptional regulator with XRE-family HTH domain
LQSLRRGNLSDLAQRLLRRRFARVGIVGRFLDPEAMINTVRKKAPNPVDRHVGSRVRMRRMMLAMSQTNLGNALGLTFQQVQKYEKGTNRIGASRLQQISHILQVPVAFFFEGAPSVPGTPQATETAPSPAYVTDFLATSVDSRSLRPSCGSRTRSSSDVSSSSWRRSLSTMITDTAPYDRRSSLSQEPRRLQPSSEFAQKSQNDLGVAIERRASSRRLGIGIKPSR